MKDTFKLFGLIASIALFFVILSLGLRAIFAPSSVAIDNATFHQSQAYQDGVANDLNSFWQDYNNTNDPDKKATIRSMVVGRYGGYNGSLPPDLRMFLNQMKTGG